MNATTKNEEWRVIDDFPHYAVSNLGRVKRIVKTRSSTLGKVLKPIRHNSGYRTVALCDGLGQTKKVLIHKLVVNAFIGKPKNGLQVNHIDGDKTNNSSTNLEIVTVSENNSHAYRIGLRKPNKKGNGYGGPINAKLMNGEVWLIKRLAEHGIAQHRIARMFKSSQMAISRIYRGISYNLEECFLRR